jgi:hypothetical protein
VDPSFVGPFLSLCRVVHSPEFPQCVVKTGLHGSKTETGSGGDRFDGQILKESQYDDDLVLDAQGVDCPA